MLSIENFWEKSGWEVSDKHLRALSLMPFKRGFPFIPDKTGLYIIRGPRQIGKSSWLKTVLSHYSKQTACYYLSCENVTSQKELAEILKSIRGTPVILLDEINFVPGWDRAVKYEMDQGQHHIFMITGSHTYDPKRGADQMPGRFDQGGEFLYLPMLFDEFLEMRRQAGWISEDRSAELRLYLEVGGFPSALAESGKEGKLPMKARKIYWKWLVGDILKLEKQQALLEELMIQIGATTQTPVSFQTLTKRTSIGSHNTVQSYIEILNSCFALKTLHAIDLDTGAFRFRKDRKFYFTDPAIYWIAHELSGAKIADEDYSKLAELVAHEHLSRKYNRMGYFSNKNGEIDFVLPKNWAIEVKWSNDARNLSKAYLQFVAPQKIVWTKRNFLDGV